MLKPLIYPPIRQLPSTRTFSISIYWFTTR